MQKYYYAFSPKQKKKEEKMNGKIMEEGATYSGCGMRDLFVE